MLCSGRSFQMVISFAVNSRRHQGSYCKSYFFEGIKSMSLLLSLNVMGSGSGGRSGDRCKVSANVAKVARGTLTGRRW